MTYTVTRQLQWPEGLPVVEISEGCLDYCNPDALVAKYPNEFKEFEDPREATEAAITILKAWREDGTRTAKIAVGATSGYTMPFEPSTIPRVRKWAKETYEQKEKCPMCGGLMPEKNERYTYEPFCEEEVCSEACAEKALEIEEAEQ